MIMDTFLIFRSPGSFRNETDFQEGMKLEVIDVYNPRMLRVASVANTEVNNIKISFLL